MDDARRPFCSGCQEPCTKPFHNANLYRICLLARRLKKKCFSNIFLTISFDGISYFSRHCSVVRGSVKTKRSGKCKTRVFKPCWLEAVQPFGIRVLYKAGHQLHTLPKKAMPIFCLRFLRFSANTWLHNQN